MSKKLISILLCACMVLSVLAFTGAGEAEDTVPENAVSEGAVSEDIVSEGVVSEEGTLSAQAEDSAEVVITGEPDADLNELAPEPASEPVSNEEPIDNETADIPEGDTLTELTLSDGSVSVSGELPEGVTLAVTPMADPFAVPEPMKAKSAPAMFKAAAPAMATQSLEVPATADMPADSAEGTGEVTVDTRWYDIKLLRDGAAVQPDGTVAVTFSDVNYCSYYVVEFTHYLDDAASIAKALANGTAQPLYDPETVNAFPVEAAAASAAGYAGAVIVEKFSTLDGTVTVNADGSATIVVSGFSIYRANGSTVSNSSGNRINMKDEDGKTFYVTPGERVYLKFGDSATSPSITFDRSPTSSFDVHNGGWDNIDFTVKPDAKVGDIIKVHGIYDGLFVYYDREVTFIVTESASITYNANGGSGAPSTKNDALVGVATTLSSTTPTRNFYVFKGWSTDPNATTAQYQAGGSFTPTSTNTTLYAVWADALNEYELGIGINEAYWLTNFNYTVGMNIPSYHRYPSEPAVQVIRYSRPTNTTGQWTITSGTNLAGKAGNYVDSSILTSNLFKKSVINDAWGVADTTGADVRSFVHFDNEQAMIEAWLQSMADRCEDNPNSDGEYTFHSYGGDLLTDINWNDEVGHDERYTIVPYVIKFETNVWRCDMVIVRKADFSLGYDLNIQNGYSITTGESGWPTESFPEGSDAVVKGAPPAHPKKVIGGVEYTAEFQYWQDGSGNRFNENDTIHMDANKVLYAVWMYPDQTQGALNVKKSVSIASNSQTPDPNQAFTIKLDLPAGGPYAYTKYSATGQQLGTGTIQNGGAVSLKNGEYVIITGLPDGQTYRAYEDPVPADYEMTAAAGTIVKGNTSVATVRNVYNKPAVADYTVEHQLENLDGTYSTVTADTQTLSGTIGEQTNAQANTYPGFTAQPFDQKPIATDTSDNIVIRYKRNVNNVTYAYTGSVHPADEPALPAASSAKFGAEVTVAAAPTAIGYTFSGWATADATVADGKFTMPDKAVAFTGSWAAKNDVSYTVKYIEQGTENEIAASKTVTGKTFNSTVTEAAVTVTGFTPVEPTSQSVTLDAYNKVIVFNYTRNSHTVNYIVENDDPNADKTVSYPFGAAIEDYAPAQTNYDFVGWFTDEAYTTPWTKPASMPDSDITVYGKFVRQTASLTVSKSGMQSGENAIFTVTGEGLPESGLRIVVPNGQSVTVSGLFVGASYTVTEDSGWSYKYDPAAPKTVKMEAKNGSYAAAMANTPKTPAAPWLSGETEKKNIFGKAANN